MTLFRRMNRYISAFGALRRGDIPKLKVLIKKHGLAVDYTRWEGGRTLAMRAALYGQLEALKFLINEKGADPNVTDKIGRSLAHHAVMFENIDMVKYLVSEAGISANAVDKEGRSLLHYASRHSHYEILKWLISEGNADLHVTDEEGRSLAHYAVKNGNIDMVKYLVSQAGISANACLLYTSPSPRDRQKSRMPSSA